MLFYPSLCLCCSFSAIQKQLIASSISKRQIFHSCSRYSTADLNKTNSSRHHLSVSLTFALTGVPGYIPWCVMFRDRGSHNSHRKRRPAYRIIKCLLKRKRPERHVRRGRKRVGERRSRYRQRTLARSILFPWKSIRSQKTTTQLHFESLSHHSKHPVRHAALPS